MQNSSDGFINLSNELAECKISLRGGNIVSYRPKNEKHDVFWMGDLNKFDNIHAIRGGVPVCWPRFAEEKLNDNFPRHGFARLSNWKLKKVNIDNQIIEVFLSLDANTQYNVEVSANLLVKITDKLECRLETINNGNTDFKFSEALHAYFNVGNRNDVIIKGLKGYQYRSSLDGKLYTLNNDLQINDEFDASFINHTGSVEIIDSTFKRAIVLNKEGSKSTIVWNPNKDLAEMSEGQYKKFICVEPANQGDLFVTLPPKEKHVITMSVETYKLG